MASSDSSSDSSSDDSESDRGVLLPVGASGNTSGSVLGVGVNQFVNRLGVSVLH